MSEAEGDSVDAVDVRPELVHLAACDVESAGQRWGDSVDEVRSDAGDVHVVCGSDRLGAALTRMYALTGPSALTYLTDTGFCVLETSVGMNQLATAYTDVERDNSRQTARAQAVVDSLGTP